MTHCRIRGVISIESCVRWKGGMVLGRPCRGGKDMEGLD